MSDSLELKPSVELYTGKFNVLFIDVFILEFFLSLVI